MKRTCFKKSRRTQTREGRLSPARSLGEVTVSSRMRSPMQSSPKPLDDASPSMLRARSKTGKDMFLFESPAQYSKSFFCCSPVGRASQGQMPVVSPALHRHNTKCEDPTMGSRAPVSLSGSFAIASLKSFHEISSSPSTSKLLNTLRAGHPNSLNLSARLWSHPSSSRTATCAPACCRHRPRNRAHQNINQRTSVQS